MTRGGLDDLHDAAPDEMWVSVEGSIRGLGRRRHVELAADIAAPAGGLALGVERAAVLAAHAQRHVGARGRLGLVQFVFAPTLQRAVGAKGAGDVFAQRDVLEGPGRRYRGVVDVAAP